MASIRVVLARFGPKFVSSGVPLTARSYGLHTIYASMSEPFLFFICSTVVTKCSGGMVYDM